MVLNFKISKKVQCLGGQKYELIEMHLWKKFMKVISFRKYREYKKKVSFEKLSPKSAFALRHSNN